MRPLDRQDNTGRFPMCRRTASNCIERFFLPRATHRLLCVTLQDLMNRSQYVMELVRVGLRL
jgi:hypothetical protein